VTSRTVLFADGSRKTLGIMPPGEYDFATEAAGLMEMLSGELEVLLPGQDWRALRSGESFSVLARSRFGLKIRRITDYCCSFLG